MMERVEEVSLNRIDINDRTFCISFGRDLERLKRSIQRRGIIVPCLLRENYGSLQYQVITGFRRIEASRAIGISYIKAFVLDRSSLSDEDAVFIALEENILTRGLNLIERAMAINIVESHLGWERERIVKEVLPAIGLHPSMTVLDAHFSLLNLIDPLKDYVISEGVSLSNAWKLSGFSKESQVVLAEILRRLKLTESTMKELLDILAEIVDRDGISLRFLLERSGILRILQESGLSKPQATQRVRYALRSERYPTLQGMERKFETLKKRLQVPPFLSITHSPYFEEEGVRVSFRFRNLSEFREIARWFNSVSEREELRRILDLGVELS